jgi:hypothetical protein
MAKMYIVMKERQSPIARFPARPFEVYQTRKQAEDRVEELNKKATTNEYWSESVSFRNPKSEQD